MEENKKYNVENMEEMDGGNKMEYGGMEEMNPMPIWKRTKKN